MHGDGHRLRRAKEPKERHRKHASCQTLFPRVTDSGLTTSKLHSSLFTPLLAFKSAARSETSIGSMFPLSMSNLSLSDPNKPASVDAPKPPNAIANVPAIVSPPAGSSSSGMAESSAAAKRRLRRIPDEFRKRNAQSCDRCRKVRYPLSVHVGL